MPPPPRSRHAPHEREVVLRYRPASPVRHVDLRGELGHWREPRPLRPVEGGAFETTLHLAPGIYAYKLRHDDGSWHLDPENPRTVSWRGARNNALVIGGTEEPVLHAPALPWVAIEDDGRMLVRAGLRRAAGDALTLRWDEGMGVTRTPMRVVAEEDEHRLFEARIASSAKRVRYVFEVGARLVGRPGGAAQAIEVTRAALTRSVPEWWREAVLYTVMIDRFARGGGRAFDGLVREDARAGGDLDGVRERLPWLRDLGVNVLHLTPIAEAPSSHRYAATDPRVVDPAIGGEAALSRLLEACARVGMRVLLDVAMTHVHSSFAPFRDVAERGPRSPYYSMFQIDSWPFVAGARPGYRYYHGLNLHEPLLDLEQPAAAELVVGIFEHWARLGVDGFRFDAVADVPGHVVRQVAAAVRAVRPDAVLFGEVVSDNGWRFLETGLDAATEFPLREALVELVVEKRIDAPEYAAIAARRRVARGGAGHRAIGFTSTHDHPRLRTLLRGDGAMARAAQLWTLLAPEVPALVWGDELGLFSEHPDRGFEGAWPDRMPMPWDEGAGDHETLAMTRALIALRRAHAALVSGDGEVHALGARALSMRRTHGAELIDVCVNFGDVGIDVALPEGPVDAELLYALGEHAIEHGRLRLGRASAVVLARRPSAEARALVAQIADGSLPLARAAYAEGLAEVPALPPRLYVTVTERCNLRCVHCITRAPELTREGRARELSSAVIEALAEPFAAARYVGFSHGGESLVSSRFFDVLAALGRARAGRPGRTDVHLLTNGMRFDPETAARAMDLGVTSLAFSLDGPSAALNDAIRPGGRFETIRSHIAAASRLRRERGLDVRMGISVVLSGPLVTDLAAMGRLAIELGVDWLKLEEMVSVSQRAALLGELGEAARVDEAVRELGEVCAAGGVVLCDHRRSSGACTCEDASAQPFRDADDFVNRARFRPCRSLWEQAVIDPDGAVRPVDYDQPVLGNVLDAPLLELWNTAALIEAREAVLRRQPARRRQVCVASTEQLDASPGSSSR